MDTSIDQLFAAAARGDQPATESLFATLYRELHRIARRELARNAVPVSLGATTVLHEAYLDMVGRSGKEFPDRGLFMGYAARVMRGVIIDHVRNRRAQKRGGQFELTSLDVENLAGTDEGRELTRMSEALDELAKTDPQLAELVDLKFFCGFSFEEIAAMRGVAIRTVQRHWEKARIYLHQSVRGSGL